MYLFRRASAPRITKVMPSIAVMFALAFAATPPALAEEGGRPLRQLVADVACDIDEGRLTKAQRRRLRRVLREVRNEVREPSTGVVPRFARGTDLMITKHHCGRVISDRALREQCVAALHHFPENAIVDTLRACDRLVDGDQDETRCVLAMTQSQTSAATVVECGRAFDGDESELRCVSAMARAPAATVRVCEEHFNGDENEMRCLERVGRAVNAIEIVNYCERLESGEENELACLERFATRRP